MLILRSDLAPCPQACGLVGWHSSGVSGLIVKTATFGGLNPGVQVLRRRGELWEWALSTKLGLEGRAAQTIWAVAWAGLAGWLAGWLGHQMHGVGEVEA